MNILYCINCEENISVSNVSSPECPKCWGNEFAKAEPSSLIDFSKAKRLVKSIELIYQSNFEKINLDFSNKMQILGREFSGSDVLSKIMNNNKPVISRKHCKIEFKTDENAFYVKDLNSTNGTFVDEKNCSSEVLLKDQSILKLGKELFVTRFLYEKVSKNNENSEPTITENELLNKIVSTFYCPDCSSIYEKDGYCLKCDVKLKKS